MQKTLDVNPPTTFEVCLVCGSRMWTVLSSWFWPGFATVMVSFHFLLALLIVLFLTLSTGRLVRRYWSLILGRRNQGKKSWACSAPWTWRSPTRWISISTGGSRTPEAAHSIPISRHHSSSSTTIIWEWILGGCNFQVRQRARRVIYASREELLMMCQAFCMVHIMKVEHGEAYGPVY